LELLVLVKFWLLAAGVAVVLLAVVVLVGTYTQQMHFYLQGLTLLRLALAVQQ
jgi:hypothetical protein